MDSPSPQGPVTDAAPRTRLRVVAVALVVLAAIVAGLWLDTRGRIGATQEELAKRLRDIQTETREARTLGRQTQEALREALVKLGALESKVAESQSQQVALEVLYQELARNRDEWQLAESRLSRVDRPQFLPVRRALTRDIDRLKSLPVLDVPGLSLTIDRLIASVDAIPLAFDERIARRATGKAAGAAPPVEESFIARLGGEVWKELRQLVVVRKVEAPESPLLPPEQAYFVRENLKLRLLNARLALLTRDEAGYREDLRVAQRWIQRYFDARAKASQGALAQLKQLAAASVSFEPPSIVDSLEAVRGFKSRRERKN